MENETIETQATETPTTASLDVWSENASTQTTETVEAPEQTSETTTETPATTTTETTTTTSTEIPASTTVEPTAQEKVVEKIIEKLPEFKDEHSKQIYELIAEGKTKEVFEFLAYQNKDFNTMSDVDVVKENLKLQNPSWTEKDIQIEIKHKFGNFAEPKDLSEIDEVMQKEEYDRAVAFNERLEEKELLLSREARDARIALEANKKTIELPKIAQDKAPETAAPTQEEIDELNRQWEAHVESEMPKLADLKFKVGDEEVSYKITDEDRRAQIDFMKDFSGEHVAKSLGWIDENGKENVVKIAEDMLKLQNFDKIISSATTQLKTKVTKDVIAEIKNVDLSPSSTTSPETSKSVEASIWE